MNQMMHKTNTHLHLLMAGFEDMDDTCRVGKAATGTASGRCILKQGKPCRGFYDSSATGALLY